MREKLLNAWSIRVRKTDPYNFFRLNNFNIKLKGWNYHTIWTTDLLIYADIINLTKEKSTKTTDNMWLRSELILDQIVRFFPAFDSHFSNCKYQIFQSSTHMEVLRYLWILCWNNMYMHFDINAFNSSGDGCIPIFLYLSKFLKILKIPKLTFSICSLPLQLKLCEEYKQLFYFQQCLWLRLVYYLVFNWIHNCHLIS